MRETFIKLATGETTRIRDSGGGGRPLVLVHGLANSLEIWDRVYDDLAAEFRVISFDLPGFGSASRPDAAYDGAFFARQLEALLDALCLERATLIGNSLGASVILRVPAVAQERIESAVLAAPGGFGRRTNLLMRIPAIPLIGSWLGRPTPSNNATTLRLALHDRANLTGELTELVNRYAALPGSDRSFVRTLRAGVSLAGSRDRESVARIASAFDKPVLVIWGRQDRIFPADQAWRAADLLPRSELVMLDRCGHYPQWEQPKAFVEAVTRFCG